MQIQPARLALFSSLAISCSISLAANAGDLILVAAAINGQPFGVDRFTTDTGAFLHPFIEPDFANNGNLLPMTGIAAGPDRTVLFGQPGGNGKVSQYSEVGDFIGIFLGDTPDPNPVDNTRGLATSADGQFLFSADWDHDDVHRFNLADGSNAGLPGDPLGMLIPGGQVAPNLGQPQAIETLANGDLLVADLFQRLILRYDGSTGALVGPFSATQTVASVLDIDELDDGRVVIAEDGSGDRIRIFAPDGTLESEFSFNGPAGVEALPDGNLLVSSASTFGQGPGLFIVAPDGTIQFTVDDTRNFGPLECITLIDSPPQCTADFNGDTVLDFFDVQAFLQAFAAQDPQADFVDDGVFDFFDVQAFLSAFAAGCP